jgi:uroporphyrinogen-III synthase
MTERTSESGVFEHQADFAGLRVVSFESRRATDLVRLVERYGGVCSSAPSMREVPLEAPDELRELVDRLREGRVDWMLFLTGVGARALARSVAPFCPQEELVALLAATAVMVRGPKPTSVMKEWKVPVALAAPEPNTWREVLSALDGVPGGLTGKRVAVQEYGVPNPRLYEGLRARGAEVLSVPVYRWAPPEDMGPLHAAISAIARREIDVVLFTSASQVSSVLSAARAGGSEEALAMGLKSVVLASIGPVCSEALREHGLEPDLEPTHPKMGHLIKETAQRASAILRSKAP